jgi:hypothetical protein
LTRGSHLFEVKSQDAAGNESRVVGRAFVAA